MTSLSIQQIPIPTAPIGLNIFPPSITKTQFQEFQNCIKQGDLAVLNRLLSEGLSINDPLPNGELPLHYAVRENQQAIVLALLRKRR